MMRKFLRLSFVFLLMSLGIINSYAQSDSDTARVRIGHFSPDAGAVDVFVNGERLLADFAFPDLTEWLEYTDTTLTLVITAPEGDINEPVLDPIDVSLEGGEWYTVAVIGEVTRETATVHVVQEDFSPIAEGETRLSVFNAIPQGQPLSLFAGDTELVAGLAYPGTQGDNDGAIDVDIVASRYDLTVSETGNDDNIVFESRRTVLGENRHYFIVAVGTPIQPDGVFTTTDMNVFTEIPPTIDPNTVSIGQGSTYLRVGHFASDAEPLALFIDGEQTDINTVSFPNLSGWVELSAGVYQIALAPEGASVDEAVVGPFDAALVGNQWQTLAVVGYQQTDSLIGRILQEDYSPILAGEARLTFLHAVPDVPPVDVVINDQVFVGALPFPGLTPTQNSGASSVDVAARRIDIEITESGNINNGYIELFDLPLVAGNHYFIAAIRGASGIDYYLLPITQQEVLDQFN